jgi:GT2 family glycosyltransferase
VTKKKEMSSLLVIVVTYNAMQWAERCFGNLKESTVVPDVYVVDNGSTDGTQAFIKKYYPDYIFLQSEINLGFGKANNLGFQYALDHNYDYVYLLNQDAWVMPNTFEKLIALSKKYTEYGILSPFQMNADMYHIDATFVSDVCSWNSNPNIMNDLFNQNLADVYPVIRVMAAHWFMPISTLKVVGGLSPSFPHYGEDDNYIDRVHYWNLKVGIVPTLKVVHDRGERVDSTKKIIYQNYTYSIRLLSMPKSVNYKSYLTVIIITLRNVKKYRTLKPFQFLWLIIKNLCTIITNRKKSINAQCAFLKKS